MRGKHSQVSYLLPGAGSQGASTTAGAESTGSSQQEMEDGGQSSAATNTNSMTPQGPLAKGWFLDSNSFFGAFPLGMFLGTVRSLSSSPPCLNKAHSCFKWHI